MGLRFRKSFKVAPGVKVNLNKKSTSVTFGGKGVHKTYSSSGKKTTSVGIPGTGAYYTTSSGGGSGSKKPSSHKRISTDNLDPVLTEDLSFQNNVADGSSASLDKLTTDSLKRYKIISAILSAFLFFVALIGFAGGSALATVICLIFGGITLAMSITYSKEIKKRLSSESSFGSSTFSGTSPDIDDKPSKKKMGCGCLTAVVLFFLVIGAISSCTDSGDKNTEKNAEKVEDTKPVVAALESLSISADTDQTYDINTEVPVTLTVTPADANIDNLTLNGSECTFASDDNGNLTFSASGAGSYIITVSCDGIESNSLTFNVEDKAAIAAEAEAAGQAGLEAQQTTEEPNQSDVVQQTQEPQEEMVWISATGSKYHSRPDCGQMDPSTSWQLSVSEAEAQGYEPCKKCH
jgi:hypothetical protein|nr:MAG TPA: Protein of unknown function (DUF4236) [Caudoviricetes sp.]